MSNFFNRVRNRLLSVLQRHSGSKEPTIISHATVGKKVAFETAQSVMEWLFFSLFHAKYFGQSHLYWFESSDASPFSDQELLRFHHRGEPVFGYRCGDQLPTLPEGYYWRLMPEHQSLRIYQLEASDDNRISFNYSFNGCSKFSKGNFFSSLV